VISIPASDIVMGETPKINRMQQKKKGRATINVALVKNTCAAIKVVLTCKRKLQ